MAFTGWGPLSGTETVLLDPVQGRVPVSKIATLAQTNPTLTGSIEVGRAADSVGMFGATPVTQPAAAAQAAIADNSGGTANISTGVTTLLGAHTFLVPVDMTKLANSQAFAIDPGFNGKLLSISYRNTVPVTTGSKAANFNSSVNGTTLTGGVVSTAGAYAVGASQGGSAITAGTQTFTSAQPIGFTVSGVTAYSEGAGVVQLTALNTDLNNAIATALAQGNAMQAALTITGAMKGAA